MARPSIGLADWRAPGAGLRLPRPRHPLLDAEPLRLIDGAADPISGAHMLARHCVLIPQPDSLLLEGVGHYPQTEAPEQVLVHYLAFRQAV